MIWFHKAAHDIMRDYDKPNDHDGPRHFEYGLGLMVSGLLQLVARRRGIASAEKAADHIAAQVADWKLHKDVAIAEDQ